MGCNCNKKTLKELEKYSDNEETFDEKKNILIKAVEFILQILFGILMAVIFIIMAIPMILYVTFCLIFNFTPSVRLIDFRKKPNKR